MDKEPKVKIGAVECKQVKGFCGNYCHRCPLLTNKEHSHEDNHCVNYGFMLIASNHTFKIEPPK